MCNSANHSPSCTCGFGGPGHLGRRSGGGFQQNNVIASIPHHSYEAFINPNAKCPVCGASVFFYQSESGSRVFFDELGPPWSKHPCTDNQQVKKRTSIVKRGSGLKHTTLTPEILSFAWQQSGWEPFLILETRIVHNNFLSIIGLHKGIKITIYLKNNLEFSEKTPFQIKTIDRFSFEMSTFSIENGNQVFEEIYKVYNHLQVAHLESIKEKKAIRGSQKKYISNKVIKKTKNQIPLKAEKRKNNRSENLLKPKKKKVKEKFKTAMELAFEKAQYH